jgi:hypothetical protein
VDLPVFHDEADALELTHILRPVEARKAAREQLDHRIGKLILSRIPRKSRPTGAN